MVLNICLDQKSTKTTAIKKDSNIEKGQIMVCTPGTFQKVFLDKKTLVDDSRIQSRLSLSYLELKGNMDIFHEIREVIFNALKSCKRMYQSYQGSTNVKWLSSQFLILLSQLKNF